MPKRRKSYVESFGDFGGSDGMDLSFPSPFSGGSTDYKTMYRQEKYRGKYETMRAKNMERHAKERAEMINRGKERISNTGKAITKLGGFFNKPRRGSIYK